MKYYIIATRVDLSGYPESFTVGYDNTATSDYDNFMFFETEAEAQEWTKSKEAAEWKNCTFEIVKDDSEVEDEK